MGAWSVVEKIVSKIRERVSSIRIQFSKATAKIKVETLCHEHEYSEKEREGIKPSSTQPDGLLDNDIHNVKVYFNDHSRECKREKHTQHSK